MANNTEVKNSAKERILDLLIEKANEAYESWLSEYDVDVRYVNQRAPWEVADELVSDATDEFLNEYPKADEETVFDDTREYIEQNYDDDFMKKHIERKENYDEILELQRDDLCLFLENMEGYQSVDRSYWLSRSRSINSIREMNTYLSEDGAKIFVEKYASDWQEAIK